MKYFIDTEFIEGRQKEKFPVSLFRKETPPTIDLISIGIVSEGGHEYYAISKDFNIDEAWNRFEWKRNFPSNIPHDPAWNPVLKEYWIRENVLWPIYEELSEFHINYTNHGEHRFFGHAVLGYRKLRFTLENLKWLIGKYGKTNEQIAKEVESIISNLEYNGYIIPRPIEFYAYFADYDWVAFCWLFGKMIDLPNGFPKYCQDLKQMLDDRARKLRRSTILVTKDHSHTLDDAVKYIKGREGFPRQVNEHNALDDAKWNLELYKYFSDPTVWGIYALEN